MVPAKGNLTSGHRYVLALLIGSSLLVLLGRLPGSPIASLLHDYASLDAAPPAIRHALKHVLFLPCAALLVVLVRLTLGIVLLGPFRSILIAVALQITGIPLGLAFLAVVVALVAAVRPWLTSMGLPYFARVSVIMAVVSGAVIAATLTAQALAIESLLQLAYFPVIALCLFADGLVRKFSSEGPRSATWRATTTTTLAVIIALVAGIPGTDDLLAGHPELIGLQIAAIVLISEFFDLRLLQDLNPRPVAPTDPVPVIEIAAAAPELALISPQPAAAHRTAPMRIAVVRNRKTAVVIERLGRPCSETYGNKSVNRVIDGLRSRGHFVEEVEGDVGLLQQLEQLGSPPRHSHPIVVFNMAYGIQGDARYTHVPAMLEMAGIPYTGSCPMGHALALDKVVAKSLMRDTGIPTPAFRVMHRRGEDTTGLRFPLIVKPRHESTSSGLFICRTAAELDDAVEQVSAKFQQGALVEEFIEGREFAVSLLGNAPAQVLPIVELQYTAGRDTVITRADKFHKTTDEPTKVIAQLDPALRQRIEGVALAVFHACHCRDYGRVDIRLDRGGTPYVLELNSMASLGAGGTFVIAAREAGYTFESLVERIAGLAADRYWTQVAQRACTATSPAAATIRAV